MNRSVLLFLFIALASSECRAQPYIITTVAGTDRVLDGKSGTVVPLRAPHAVAADSAGNVYIADTDDNRVRKVNSSGIISTYAGTGTFGFAGDRGKAAQAQLSGPIGLALDSSGNLYIAERDGFRVRKVTLDGTINTVAGTGRPGTGGDNGPAVNAQVSPLAVAVDNQGNLYISTYDFHIRKVDSKGIITTIAGTGSAAFFGDSGPANQAAISLVVQLAADNNGNLYLADYANFRVRKIDSAGIITTIAGSGTIGLINEGVQATAAVMIPDGIALDGSGNLYLSDFNRDLVRRVSLSAGTITTVAGDGNTGFQGDGGSATRAEFNTPQSLAIDSSNTIYVADFGNNRVRKISASIVTTIAGTSIGDGGPATSAFLNVPVGVAVDGAGNVVVADGGNFEARRFTVGGSISKFGQVRGDPTGVAADQAGNFYVVDDEPLVLMVKADGTTKIVAGNSKDGYSGDGGSATSAAISEPTGVAVDSGGNIYFTDFNHNRIRKVSAGSNTITTIAGNGSAQFSGDGGQAAQAGMDPYDIAIDTKNNIYIADRGNNRVRKITPDGIISTAVGTGLAGYTGDGGLANAAQINFPTGVALDAAGNLFVADSANAVVRRVTAGGLITTIAGNGTITPATGDGGPATSGQVSPVRVAVDAAGNVFVSDLLNDRVRKLAPQVVAPKSLSIVSGNNQTGTVNAALPLRLVVQVIDAAGAPVPGVVVTFTVSSVGQSSATPPVANPSQAITLLDGTAGTSLTLGSAPGTVSVVASAGGLNAPFSITAISPTTPVISPGGIASAGLSSPAVTILSPNTIASIFGNRFATADTARQVGVDDLVNGKIPTILAGVCVTFGSQRAPIFAVFPGQLNVQVPQVPTGQVTVQVITKCDTPQAETSAAMTVAIQSASPEFFYFVHNGNGRNPIAALNAVTGGYVGAPGLISGVTSAAAKPGDILTLFATGFGATDPSFAPGELPAVAAQVTAPVTVVFGGVTLAPSDILYAGVSQNAGLYQLNLRVPDAVPSGDQTLIITIGNVSSPAGAFITVSR